MARTAFPLLPLTLVLAALPAASRDLDQDEALQLSRAGRIMALEPLLHTIAKLYPKAQLLEVELEEHQGQYLYDIDLLTADGVARELEVDARNGQLLSDKEDD